MYVGIYIYIYISRSLSLYMYIYYLPLGYYDKLKGDCVDSGLSYETRTKTREEDPRTNYLFAARNHLLLLLLLLCLFLIILRRPQTKRTLDRCWGRGYPNSLWPILHYSNRTTTQLGIVFKTSKDHLPI